MAILDKVVRSFLTSKQKNERAVAQRAKAVLRRFPAAAELIGCEVGVYRGEMSAAMLAHNPRLVVGFATEPQAIGLDVVVGTTALQQAIDGAFGTATGVEAMAQHLHRESGDTGGPQPPPRHVRNLQRHGETPQRSHLKDPAASTLSAAAISAKEGRATAASPRPSLMLASYTVNDHAYAFCSGGNPKNLGMAATYVDDLHLGVADRFLLI